MPVPFVRPRQSPTLHDTFRGRPVRIAGSRSHERVVLLDGCVVGEVVLTYRDPWTRSQDRWGYRLCGVLHHTPHSGIREAAGDLLRAATAAPALDAADLAEAAAFSS